MVLAGEEVLPRAEHWRQMIQERAGEEADLHIADARYGHAHVLAQRVIRHQGRLGRTLSDRIDRLVLDRVFGIPLFLLVMYLMFMFTIHIGGAFIDFFDGLAGALLVDGPGSWMRARGWPEWLAVPLADGVGGGLQVVATFIPIITCLYLFLSVLEDSGYMARAAFVMDRFMSRVGLHGKNLGDEDFKTAGYCFGDTGGCAVVLGLEDNTTIFYGPPRTVTATVEYRF